MNLKSNIELFLQILFGVIVYGIIFRPPEITSYAYATLVISLVSLCFPPFKWSKKGNDENSQNE